MKLIKIIVLFFLLFSSPCHAANWYVDNAALGKNDGTSWTDAWESFADIVWGGAGVVAGDTLYISGGNGSKTYNEQLAVGESGSDGSLISIKPGATDSSPSGHDGVVTITNASGSGVYISAKSYVDLNGNDGAGNRKIRLTGSLEAGIEIGVSSGTGVKVSYLTVDANGTTGTTYLKNGVYVTDIPSTGSSTGLLEISYCYLDHNLNDSFRVLGNGYSCTTYDRVLIHHNEITNVVDDGCEAGAACGVSFYNNYMHEMSTDAGGHPDGFVSNGCPYLKVYNNKIENMLLQSKHFSSYLLISAQTITDEVEVNNIQVYNNLLIQENFDSWIITKDGARSTTRGIEITKGPNSQSTAMKNWLIANNTIIGMPFYGFSFYPGDLLTGAVDNILIESNIISDCSRAYSGSPGVVSVGEMNDVTAGSIGDSVDVIIDKNIFYEGDYGYVSGGVWDGVYINSYTTWKSTSECQDNDPSNDERTLKPTAPQSFRFE
jgi:hypothetical protein